MLKKDGSRKMEGDFLPNVTNTYYCGKSTNKWVYGYFQKLNAGLSSHLEPLLDATYRLGSATRSWKELYLNSLKTDVNIDGDITILNGKTLDGDIILSSGKLVDAVLGELRLPATVPSSPVGNKCYYSSTNNQLRVYKTATSSWWKVDLTEI